MADPAEGKPLRRSTKWANLESHEMAREASKRSPTVSDQGGTDPSAHAMRRYEDAYLIARAMVGIGSFVKVCGPILGGVVALVGPARVASGSDGDMVVAGLITGAVIALIFFVAGIFISGNGQALKATLDCAVHSSPFLNDDQRAIVMSLK